MGSATILDIISSALIGGVLHLAVIRLNDKATSTTYQC